MRRLVARKVSYRFVAVLCFALGAGGYFWFTQKEPESRILVHPLPVPRGQAPFDARNPMFDYDFGPRIMTCGRGSLGQDNPSRSFSEQQKKECMLKAENARKFILKNWKEKRKSYMTLEYPCDDCLPVFDVMIEQSDEGEWQITILRERDLTSESYQTVAVALKRRRAGEREAYSHVPGELLLVFVDEDGQEILAL